VQEENQISGNKTKMKKPFLLTFMLFLSASSAVENKE